MKESIESGNTNIENSEILQLAEKYAAKVDAELATGNSQSMRHILNNKVSGLRFLLVFKEDGTLDAFLEKEPRFVQDIVKEIDEYFDLLDKYPEFKAGEKGDKLGYFADKGIVSIDTDEGAYREALEKEAKN